MSRSHAAAVGVVAVAASVLAIGLLRAVTSTREPRLGELVQGTLFVACLGLWPAVVHVALLLRAPRRRRERMARASAAVAACAATVAWTAYLSTDDSSTAVLGFIWLPPIAWVAGKIVWLALRGEDPDWD